MLYPELLQMWRVASIENGHLGVEKALVWEMWNEGHWDERCPVKKICPAKHVFVKQPMKSQRDKDVTSVPILGNADWRY